MSREPAPSLTVLDDFEIVEAGESIKKGKRIGSTISKQTNHLRTLERAFKTLLLAPTVYRNVPGVEEKIATFI